MYEPKEKAIIDSGTSPIKEHIMIANQFTDEMISRFDPIELNEIVSKIRERLISVRKAEIKQKQDSIQYLEDTLKGL